MPYGARFMVLYIFTLPLTTDGVNFTIYIL